MQISLQYLQLYPRWHTLQRLPHISGCVGCICVQVFYNPETEDIVGIEINPRFGGGYPLTYKAGGDFSELMIREYFLGESIDYLLIAH